MATRAKRDDSPTDVQLPLLGGLLRLAHQELVNEVTRTLAAGGISDVRPAQYAVCQQLAGHPDGLRLTELAAHAGVTKPSMSALVDGLEAAGYVERGADPRDGRAQIVRFTPRGRRLSEAARRAVLRFERAWEERVGVREIAALRRVLRAIVDTRPGLESYPRR